MNECNDTGKTVRQNTTVSRGGSTAVRLLITLLLTLCAALPPATGAENTAHFASMADAWPEQANNNLAHAGIFYGSAPVGILTGNSQIAIEHSRRWRAQRNGQIDAVRYNNRTLGQNNIDQRCEQYGRGPNSSQPYWCECKDNGIDANQCGYYLRNSYSVGNGGRQLLELRRDDGKGSPDMSVTGLLGRTASAFVPVEASTQYYPALVLEEPVTVTAGHIYHTVYRNLAPPENCSLGGVRPAPRTRACATDRGAISLNGVLIPEMYGDAGKLGPWMGQAAANLFRNELDGEWSSDPDSLSWHEVRYTDGIWTGFAIASYNVIFRSEKHGDGSNVRKVIGGATTARQVFTVRDSDRAVTGVWVLFGHHDARADGSSLNVVLRDEHDQQLAAGELGYNAQCNERSGDTSRYTSEECRAWGYVPFDRQALLKDGREYRLDFSGSANAHFALSAHFPLAYPPYESTNIDFWNDSRAMISDDRGKHYRDWIGNYHPGRDLGVLFTLANMPLKLP